MVVCVQLETEQIALYFETGKKNTNNIAET